MTRKKAEALLAAIIVARSASYLLMKICLNSMGPFTMLAVRFLLAFFALALLFGKRLCGAGAAAWGRGALLGGAFFIVMATQTLALKTTGSSTVSFLESTAIVLVPLFNALLQKRPPSPQSLFASLLCVVGVGLLTLKGGAFTLSGGEWLCLCSAFCYAVSILLTDFLSKREDPLVLGILQVGFVGLFNLIASVLFETPRLPGTASEWGVILMLALVCSAFGFTLQPVAQRYTSAERAGQFCALTPLSATLMGVLFLRERLGICGMAGAGLILLSMLYTGQTARAADIGGGARG